MRIWKKIAGHPCISLISENEESIINFDFILIIEAIFIVPTPIQQALGTD